MPVQARRTPAMDANCLRSSAWTALTAHSHWTVPATSVKHLFVWVRRADGTFKPVGELATTDPVAAGGRFESEFEYSRDWIADPRAFALDPVSLPLQPPGRRFRAEQFHPPLSVFDDALPDDWGRRLLGQALKLVTAVGALAATVRKQKVRGGNALETVHADIRRRLKLIGES